MGSRPGSVQQHDWTHSRPGSHQPNHGAGNPFRVLLVENLPSAASVSLMGRTLTNTCTTQHCTAAWGQPGCLGAPCLAAGFQGKRPHGNQQQATAPARCLPPAAHSRPLSSRRRRPTRPRWQHPPRHHPLYCSGGALEAALPAPVHSWCGVWTVCPCRSHAVTAAKWVGTRDGQRQSSSS